MTFNPHVLHDTARSIDERVQHLIDHMTLDEKIAQLVGVWASHLLDEARTLNAERCAQHLAHGIGHITRVAGSGLMPPVESAEITNGIQKHLIESTRLGIPAIVHEESCAGYMARGATTFPQAIGLAAAWSPDLVGEMTAVIREQMRAAGAHQALAPVLDLARDARWGRVEETFGEDPFLTTAIGLAYVRGLQTDDLKQGVAATVKHFLAHGAPEGGMNWAPVHVGARELREMFLPPFLAAIRLAGVESVMNAYHELDGDPCGGSRALMVDLLRGELGFTGVVTSDYFTLRALVNYHRVAADEPDAARMGIEAGIDVELPTADLYAEPLRRALENGTVEMAQIDASVRRVLALKFRLGIFERPYIDSGRVLEVFNTPEQRALSRRIAAQSLVLLKNEGDLLPLSPALRRIAVIGQSADSARLMQGDYHYPAHLEHIFDAPMQPTDGAPNPEQPPVSQNVAFDWSVHLPQSVTVLEGIRALVSPDTVVDYAQGCAVNSDDTSGIAAAVEAARAAEVAILVLGDKSGLGDTCTVGESLDSATLRLPGAQVELLEAVYATGTPVVLVLMTGRPYDLSWADAHIPAIVEAWLPAQEGGAAVADVLFGVVNPGGRLPISFPRSAAQIPVFYNHKPSGGRSHWKGAYRDLSTKPLYPFGYGLSYTRFAYSDLTLSRTHAAPGDVVTVGVTVTNTGARAGDEVVQLYVSDPIASLTRPVRALRGFTRVTLQPGEARVVQFDLDVRHLAFYDRQMVYAVEAGEIIVGVGASSADIRLTGSFTITETAPVEPVFTTPVRLTQSETQPSGAGA